MKSGSVHDYNLDLSISKRLARTGHTNLSPNFGCISVFCSFHTAFQVQILLSCMTLESLLLFHPKTFGVLNLLKAEELIIIYQTIWYVNQTDSLFIIIKHSQIVIRTRVRLKMSKHGWIGARQKLLLTFSSLMTRCQLSILWNIWLKIPKCCLRQAKPCFRIVFPFSRRALSQFATKLQSRSNSTRKMLRFPMSTRPLSVI